MDVEKESQVVVIGAGPAGLGAAIGLARQGVAVTVLERQTVLGSDRRGETIRFDPFLEEILGRGFFDRIAIKRVDKRRYWSHSGRCSVNRSIKNPNIIFSWPALIGEMARVAEGSHVRILTGCEVEGLIERSGVIRGVAARTDQGHGVFTAGTVFACGGISDPVFRHLGLNRAGMDMAIRKRLVKGYAGPTDCLEYHFHLSPGGLVVGTVFPRAQGEAEFILLDTSGKDDALPSFDGFCAEHQAFARLMQGTEAFYELDTSIPMGGKGYPFSPRPGIVMAGDVIGHVQARGGSGIRASFLIGHGAGTLAADVLHGGGWDKATGAAFEKALAAHPQARALRRHNLVYGTLRKLLFTNVRTPEEMDRRWPLLKIALR